MLSPYRVLDLTDDKGFLCGKILADLGADVIKIENPDGDLARYRGSFYNHIADPERNLYWLTYNCNKRGITLNIQSNEGKVLFKKLVKTADFIIESFSPGYMDEIDLSYESLSIIRPSVILVSVTPFGQTGPYKDYQACDLIVNSLSGLQYITGDSDRAPLRCSIEQSYLHASAWGAMGALFALHQRRITGQGQHVDVSALDSMVAVGASTFMGFWDLLRTISKREGGRTSRGSILVRLIWPCKDGNICWRLFAGAPLSQFTVNLVELMDAEGMAGSLKNVNWAVENMATMSQERWDKWEEAFAPYFLLYSQDELYQRAIDRGVLLFPVNTAKGILEDQQLNARNFWQQVEYPDFGTSLTQFKGPFKSNIFSSSIWRKAPRIGEHNEEIYAVELGLSGEQLSSLKKRKVI